MTNIDYAIDTYRDNQLNDYLNESEKNNRYVSFGPAEKEDEIIVVTSSDMEELFKKKELENHRHCTQCSKPITEGCWGEFDGTINDKRE